MLLHWIWFAHRPGVSDRMKLALLQVFADAQGVYAANSSQLDQIPGLKAEARQSLLDKDLTHAEQILEFCRREQLRLLTIQDPAYPARLKNISDPPVLLYCKGTLPSLDDRPAIGVVGTRRGTDYGLATARQMGWQISRCGGVVVSGLALGVDAMAMSGALDAGSPVVGVVGCGVDVVYPKTNRVLFQKTQCCGCILSEFAPGTQPTKWTFPKRNRIVSGLCNGVLVVEAPEKSGSLITARLALEQGRDVFVVPGRINTGVCAGSNRLLREGATVVFSGWDVMSEYEARYPGQVHKDDTGLCPTPLQEENTPEPAEKSVPNTRKSPCAENPCHKKIIDNPAAAPYSDLNTKLEKLSPEERAIAALLGRGEQLVDTIVAETGISASRTLQLLTMLELQGLIRRLPGNRVALR